MKRRLWGILWVMSLLLSLAMLLLWARSYFRAYSINRTIAVGNGFDGEERETFAVSNRGWFFIATNWTQYHNLKEEPHESGKHWFTLSFPPPDNYLPPAYFPMKYQLPDGGYGWSMGFDARIISMGHFVHRSVYRSDWTNRATWAMTVPHWLVALIFVVLPAIRMRQAMRARRMRRRIELGRCIRCGYDLRGGGERCPECGGEATVAG